MSASISISVAIKFIKFAVLTNLDSHCDFSMALAIEDIVRATIVGQSRSINLTPDLFWKAPCDNAPTFVKLVKGKSEINRLLGQPIASKGKGMDKRKLQFTSIIETLTDIRNTVISAMIDTEKKTRKN